MDNRDKGIGGTGRIVAGSRMVVGSLVLVG